MKTIHVFHHTDLDGMGVKILGILYSKSKGLNVITHKCGYNRINNEIIEILKNPDNIEEIIIGDISVNSETANELDKIFQKGVPVRLRDHHGSASWLNRYPWAIVQETDSNLIPRCGTWWLAQDPDFQNIRSKCQIFIDWVNDWDTWRWKRKWIQPKQLNALFSLLGEEKFTSTIIDKIENSSGSFSGRDLFDERISIMLEVYDSLTLQRVEQCERHMYQFTLKISNKLSLGKGYFTPAERFQNLKLKTGVIFLNDNISEIGDMILERNPKLDLLAIMALPCTISWRTIKNLGISLNKIALYATGNGGGHYYAAASSIPGNKFQDMLNYFFDNLFSRQLSFNGVVSSNFLKKKDKESPDKIKSEIQKNLERDREFFLRTSNQAGVCSQ